jgi:tripartite-type tricarboxylate transporter receptor subunit TctC
MTRTARPSLRRWLVGCAWALFAASALAWPDRPVRVVIPFPPGGPTDIVMRLAAEKMQAALKQPFIVENKAGAGGNLGTAEVARAVPDGYTWLWTPDTVLTVNPHVYKRLGWKPEDLVPVSIGASFSQTLVCHATGPRSVPDLVRAARASKMAYASGGAGVPGHLAMELLQSTARFDMDHIPYKGPAPAVQDVLGGQVPCGFLAGPTVLPHVRSGALNALAVSGTRRSPALPEVPTVAESGHPGYDATFLLIALAPKGTPEAAMAGFQRALAAALRDPEVAGKLAATDQQPVGSTAREAVDVLAATSRKWGEVARRINLSLD